MKAISKHKIKTNLLPNYSYHQTFSSRGWTKTKKNMNTPVTVQIKLVIMNNNKPRILSK